MSDDVQRNSPAMGLDAILVKQEPASRENTPFSHASLTAHSRHTTPATQQRPTTPIPDIPCSQESTATQSTAPVPLTPVLAKVEKDVGVSTTPLTADNSPATNPSSARRKKRKSRRGKGGITDSTPNTVEPPPSMNLTHANKHWFDVFQTKQSSQSVSTYVTEQQVSPPTVRIEEQFNYVKEILQRSLSFILLPLRWAVHWAAIYILPFAIAVGVLVLLIYMVFPRFIFSAIPGVLGTTTSLLAFPAKLLVSKGPEMYCSVIGLGCSRNGSEGEEVVRNATFATDLEVRNAFTVIHNLNYLNNSSNRLVLDSVSTPHNPSTRLTYCRSTSTLSAMPHCTYPTGPTVPT
jgi:hypothetical protein